MKAAIIVAGGKGLRMGGDLSKQFLPVGGRPILMHTLEVFERAIPGIQLILVLPHDQQDFWRDLCCQHAFTLPHTIVDGGATRFHSVKNGLESLLPSAPSDASLTKKPSNPSNPLNSLNPSSTSIPLPNRGGAGGEAIVAIHDGVRPFVSVDVIRSCFSAACDHAAVVPVIPVVETVRQLTSHPSSLIPQPSITLDRSCLRLVQTPQVFSLDLLLRAYEQPYCDAFTDDASVVEAMGHPVTLVEGNRENIKITTPFDLTIAEALLREASR